jgi:hypothetical protein
LTGCVNSQQAIFGCDVNPFSGGKIDASISDELSLAWRPAAFKSRILQWHLPSRFSVLGFVLGTYPNNH